MLPRSKNLVLLKSMRNRAKEKSTSLSLPSRVSPLALYILPPKGKLANATVYAPYPLKFFYDVYGQSQDTKWFRKHRHENPYNVALGVFLALKNKRVSIHTVYHYIDRFKPLFSKLKYVSHPIMYSHFVIDMSFLYSCVCNGIKDWDWSKIIRRFCHLAPNGAKVWIINAKPKCLLHLLLEGQGFHWSKKGYYIKKVKRGFVPTIRRL